MPATRSPNPNLNLIFIGGRGTMMDNTCAKFGDFSFSRFGFIVQTHRQNHRCTARQDKGRRMIAILSQLHE